MDTKNGHIYALEGLRERFNELSDAEFKNRFKPMEVAPTPGQMARKPPKVGRNDPCPCGSGKKFKKCCLK